jgi:hypothetical protein
LLIRCQGDKWHQPVRSGDSRHYEAIEVVGDSPGDEFSERARVSSVCFAQTPQISIAVSGVDDGRGIPEAHQDQVDDETPGSSVSVEEWMDSFEVAVCRGN